MVSDLNAHSTSSIVFVKAVGESPNRAQQCVLNAVHGEASQEAGG